MSNIILSSSITFLDFFNSTSSFEGTFKFMIFVLVNFCILLKYFTSRVLTKLNGVLDNCKEVVESQIKSLNALTPTEKTKYEINSRKKLIKEIISKIDDLTNELILSEDSNLEDVIEQMDELIGSVKEY